MRKEVNGGFIEYRLPRISEVYLLAPKFSNINQTEGDMLLAFGRMIDEDLERFITKIDIGEIKTFNQLMERLEYFSDVSEIGKEILESLNQESFKKKVL